MAQTVQQYTGDGSTTLFSIPFPYIESTDIKVRLNGVDSTAFTFANSTTIQFNTAPASSVNIQIFRQTDDSSSKATFSAGSALKATDLNSNFQQNLFINQETVNQSASTLGTTFSGDVNFAVNSKISFEGTSDDNNETTLTVSNPTADRTITLPDVSGTVVTTGDTGSVSNGMLAGNSVDSSKIINGTIVDADINASANISGSKLQAASGSNSGSMSSSDKTKLDTIETSAKDDQTGAEIKSLYEGENNTNAFTDTEKSKLQNIENNAKDDQTGAEIKGLYEGESNTNAFTDAEKTKLSSLDLTKLQNIEVNATQDQTASEIKTLYESNSNTNPLTDVEKAVIDGVTANTGEINKLDGFTGSTSDLNQVSGMSKQTTITNSDSHFPTSGAVVDFVANQIAPVGGLEVIADEDSFPATQPVSGVVISITNADGLVINSSGVATNARTLGNGSDNVTINNFPVSLRSKTLSPNLGLLVSSTGASQTYNYHKLLAKEEDVLQLSDDINDFNSRYRVVSTNPTSENDAGDLIFNTSTSKLLVYNATSGAYEEAQSVGNFFISTLSPAFDGSTQNFTITNAPSNAQQIILSINGVVQRPNAGSSVPSEGFALSGNTIKLAAAPPSGSDYFAIVLGSTVNIGTPSNNTVTSAMIVDGSIVNGDISNSADISGSKLSLVSTSSTAGVIVKGDGSSDGYLQLNCSQNSHGIKLKSPPHSASQSYTLTFPSAIVNGAFLKTDSNGNLSFAAVNTDLVNDTTPQLGGDLATNSNDIVFADADKAIFGTGSDMELLSDGSTSFIRADDLRIRSKNNLENHITCAKDGAVKLYHDNIKKLETTSDGITVTGNLLPEANNTRNIGNGSTNFNSIWASTRFRGNDNVSLQLGNSVDFKIRHDGTHNLIEAPTGADLKIMAGTGDNANETCAIFNHNGAVELYHDNTKRIFTESAGGAISGKSRFLGHQQGTGANATEVHFNADSGHIGIHFSGHGQINRTYTAARMMINGTGGTYGTITYSLGGTGYNSQSSDSRSKKNIVEWTESELDKFKNLQPKLFHFEHNVDSDPKYKGYIAQDNVAAFPEAYPLVDDRYMFNPSGMVHYLMKAVQELTNKVETLETKVAILEAK